MGKGEGSKSTRDDDVGGREHFAAADGADRAPHTRTDQRPGKRREEPCARDVEVMGDTVGDDGRQIIGGCPRQRLCRTQHDNHTQLASFAAVQLLTLPLSRQATCWVLTSIFLVVWLWHERTQTATRTDGGRRLGRTGKWHASRNLHASRPRRP